MQHLLYIKRVEICNEILTLKNIFHQSQLQQMPNNVDINRK